MRNRGLLVLIAVFWFATAQAQPYTQEAMCSEITRFACAHDDFFQDGFRKPITRGLSVLLSRLEQARRKDIVEELFKLVKTEYTLTKALLWKSEISAKGDGGINLAEIQPRVVQYILVISVLQVKEARGKQRKFLASELQQLHDQVLGDFSFGADIFRGVFDLLQAHKREQRLWLRLSLPRLCAKVEQDCTTLVDDKQWAGVWQKLQPVFDEAVALFVDLSVLGSLPVLESLQQWFKQEYAVGNHPGFLLALSANDRFLQIVPTDSEFSGRNAFAYLQWLAAQAARDKIRAKTVLPLLLQIATRHQNQLLLSPFPPQWETKEPPFWQEILKPAIIHQHQRYDAAEYRREIGELTEIKEWTSQLPNSDLIALDFLRGYGQHRLEKLWLHFNSDAKKRAEAIEGFRRGTALTNERFAQMAQTAFAKRQELEKVLGNPFCALHLAFVAKKHAPESLEAGLVMRWFSMNLRAEGLSLAIEREWQELITASKRDSDHEKWLSLDQFDFWENLRGKWFAKVQESNKANFREQITKQETLIHTHWNRIQNWLSDPSPSLTGRQKVSLSSLCWLGVPLPVQNLNRLRTALSEALQAPRLAPEEANFLRACQMHLVVSAISHGESLSSALADEVLLGADAIELLPDIVDKLYQDGRPFCVRAAVDICMVFGNRSLLTDLYGKTTHRALAVLLRLNPLLKHIAKNYDRRDIQGGLGLSLLSLYQELLVDDQFKQHMHIGIKRNSPNFSFPQNFSLRAMGTGFWGLNYWLRLQEMRKEKLYEKHLLSVEPLPEVFPASFELHLAAVSAFLTGLSQPPRIQAVFLRRVENGKLVSQRQANGQWNKLEWWNNVIKANKTIPSEHRFAIFPWDTSATTPIETISGIVDRTLALKNIAQRRGADIDGLDKHYLPVETWANNQEQLQREIEAIKDLEDTIRGQYNALQIQRAIKELKPLLAAPLVVDIASFKEDMKAAIAEVRRAEAGLSATREESLAAEMELIAQQLLTEVHRLEQDRTKLLLEIQHNEVDRQKLEKQIKDNEIAIEGHKAEKNNVKARYDDLIAKLNKKDAKYEEKKAELEKKSADEQLKFAKDIALLEVKNAEIGVEQSEIELRIVARSVAAIKNQVELLQNLITKEMEHPEQQKLAQEGKLKRGQKFSGMLGVLAFNAEIQVGNQLRKINEQKQKLERELDKLREANCIKGVCKLIGGIVGYLVGGPFGAKLGGMIGGAVGEIVAGIVQKKPLDKILVGLADDTLNIAMTAGFDIPGKLNGLGKDAGIELSSALEDLEGVLGPVLEEFPAFLTKSGVAEALDIAGLQGPLQKILQTSKDILQTGHEGASNLGNLGDIFVAGVGEMAASGDPKDMLRHMENKLVGELREKFKGNLEDLKAAARDLGMQAENLATFQPEHYEEMAHKVSLLVMGRVGSNPRAKQSYENLLRNFMVWSSELQKQIQQPNVADINQAINSSLANLTAEERKAAQKFLSLFQDIPIQNKSLPWDRVSEKIEQVLKRLFPNNPKMVELTLGQFQLQLDSAGAQAQMQQWLQDWNKELNQRMAAVEKKLGRPVSGGQEQKIKQQIQHLNEAGKELQEQVLKWLLDRNNRQVTELREQLKQKISELKKAQDELDIADLDLAKSKNDLAITIQETKNEIRKAKTEDELAAINLKIAENLLQKTKLAREKIQKEVQIQSEIDELAKGIATLASQQAAISLQNAQLQEQRVVLQQEQDRLRFQSNNVRQYAAKHRLNAARKKVDAAVAELDAAIARKEGARKRSVVFGKIETWYRSARNIRQNENFELKKLQLEYYNRLQKACALVRKQLRFLRILGSYHSAFPFPNEATRWSTHLGEIAHKLKIRLEENRPVVDYLQLELTSKQIEYLFSAKGLDLFIEHEQPENWLLQEGRDFIDLARFAIDLKKDSGISQCLFAKLSASTKQLLERFIESTEKRQELGQKLRPKLARDLNSIFKGDTTRQFNEQFSEYMADAVKGVPLSSEIKTRLIIEEAYPSIFPYEKRQLLREGPYKRIIPERYQRVFLVFVAMANKNGDFYPDTNTQIKITKDFLATLLEKNSSGYKKTEVLSNIKPILTTKEWGDSLLPATSHISHQEIDEHVKNYFEVPALPGIVTKDSFQKTLGPILPGKFHLRATGSAPERFRLIFAYSKR